MNANERALHVACPKCLATIGVPCGRHRNNMNAHRERIDAAPRPTDGLHITIAADDGGEPMPRDGERLSRMMIKLQIAIARDLAKKEGKRLPMNFASGYSMGPHKYDAPVPTTPIVGVPAPGSKWLRRKDGGVVRVLASGTIGQVCATGHMWAMEASSIWPGGWPEYARIVVYQREKKNAWAYVQRFLENHE